MSIILPNCPTDDNTDMRDMERWHRAHAYAKKKFPKEYKRRNKKKGEDKLITIVLGAHVHGAKEQVEFGGEAELRLSKGWTK